MSTHHIHSSVVATPRRHQASPARPSPPGLPRTRPLPCPRPHSDGRRHAWNTSVYEFGSPTLNLRTFICLASYVYVSLEYLLEYLCVVTIWTLTMDLEDHTASGIPLCITIWSLTMDLEDRTARLEYLCVFQILYLAVNLREYLRFDMIWSSNWMADTAPHLPFTRLKDRITPQVNFFL